MIIYTNIKSEKDIVRWHPTSGKSDWDIVHRDGLKSYLGDDGSKIQIMWEFDAPVFYHGW